MAMYEISSKSVFLNCMFYNMVLRAKTKPLTHKGEKD